jgi:RimJ/RimL family protein N-acetyltransferase
MTHWQDGLPTLTGDGVTLRELRRGDSHSLFSLLSDDQVAQFISPPPTSPEGFERFIAWTAKQRAAGTYACFGVVPRGLTEAVGVFQVRQLQPDFDVAEWGFILAHSFWGTGIFAEAAHLVLEFAFDTVGVHRLEARAAVPNGRGHGALSKLGAFHEVRLRKSFWRDGVRYDQMMWSILAEDWREARGPRSQRGNGTNRDDSPPYGHRHLPSGPDLH